PPANGNSPYSSTSAFAGNPLLISLERLAERGWLDAKRLSDSPQTSGDIDYDEVRRHKLPLLCDAARAFVDRAAGGQKSRFEQFCRDNNWWLEDYVLFDALRERYNQQCWSCWDPGLARREPAALGKARRKLASELALRRVIQFFFWEQWRAIRHRCAERSIRIVGDIAIFVDYDSADVWANRGLFRLKENLEPEVVSGVPPDAFSATGQRWGNPLYNWDVMRSRGYGWWISRLRWATQTCDYIRLDHFRGFAQFWEIPADEPTAIHGRWVDGPGDEFFNAVRNALGGLPFFAEDLGLITPDVHALRDRHHIPGMAVLQFGFGDQGAHMYLPHRMTEDRAIYTGTHDNDATLGWWQSTATGHEKWAAETYVGKSQDGINWGLIRAAQTSPASFSVIPIQDVLGLGSEARLNTPSTHEGNYHWRFRPGALTRDLTEKLAHLAEVTDRMPQAVPVPAAEEFVA